MQAKDQKNSDGFELLEHISAGDLLVGMLLSSRSTSRMRRIAYQRAYARYRTKKQLTRLEKLGLVHRRRTDGDFTLSITLKGRVALLRMRLLNKKRISYSPKTWDKKWHMITYSFSKKNTRERKSLQYILTKLGWLQIHKNVWIFPYESTEMIELLTQDDVLQRCTQHIVCDSISGDTAYKKHFSLISS